MDAPRFEREGGVSCRKARNLLLASIAAVILCPAQGIPCDISLTIYDPWRGGPYVFPSAGEPASVLKGYFSIANSVGNPAGDTIVFDQGRCTVVPGNEEFSCPLTGDPGPNTLTDTARFTDTETGDTCTATLLPYDFVFDPGEPSYEIVYPPNINPETILCSTDSIIVRGLDDVSLGGLRVGSLHAGAVTNCPLADNIVTEAVLSFPLKDMPSGPANVSVSVADCPLRTKDGNLQFKVDAERPQAGITQPLTVTDGTGEFTVFTGTATDDIGLREINIHIHEIVGGTFWDGVSWSTSSSSGVRIPVAGPLASWSFNDLAGQKIAAPALYIITASAMDMVGKQSSPQQLVINVLPPRLFGIPKTIKRPPCPIRSQKGLTDLLTGKLRTMGKAINGFLQGGSPSLSLTTTYNGEESAESRWGFGWGCEQDEYAQLNEDGSFMWTDGSGAQRIYLAPKASLPDRYIEPVNTYKTMTVKLRDEGGSPTVIERRDEDGTTVSFNRAGASPGFFASQLRDRNGNTVTYVRDLDGKLLSAVDVHSRRLSISYNPQGMVGSVGDSGGGSVGYQYDPAGNRIAEIDPMGDVTQYAYDADRRVAQITHPNGARRSLSYDGQGRVSTEQDDHGENKNTYTYYPSSTAVTDALGRTMVYDYASRSGLRMPTMIRDAAGKVTQSEYDGNMNLIRSIDALGRVTRLAYDAKGNVTSVTDPAGKVATLEYEPNFNRVSWMVDPKGNRTEFTYNGSGDLTQVRDALGKFTVMDYDSFGHVWHVWDPLGKMTTLGYDGNGALNLVRDPLNRTTALERDAYGHVTLNIDPKGLRTSLAYDAVGNLTRVTDAAQGVTSYGYVPGRDGRLLQTVTDAKGHATTFTHDLLDRLIGIRNALNQAKSFTYDKKGNLTSATDAKGQTITFEYDDLDRPIRKILPEGTVTYEYDDVGNLTRVSHPNGSIIAMSYDQLNRVIEVRQTLPNANDYTVVLTYGYDDNGNRASMGTPWGNFSYTYDALNRLKTITNPQSELISFDYDDAGRRTKLTYPNGIETNYAYDDAGQLLSIEAKRMSDNVVVASAAYTYDLAGNRTSMRDPAGLHSYGYDPLHRLISASHPLGSSVQTELETFDYDKVGNRTADASITGYQYDDANRLTDNSSYTYTYDANGNQTSKTDKATGELTEYSYDSENRMIEAKINGQSIGRYTMDALGRRVEKSTGPIADPTVTRFVYDGFNILGMLDASNQPVAVFTQGMGINEPLVMRKADAQEYFSHADGLGSITSLTDPAGQVVERVEYAAYGQPTFIDVRGPPRTSANSFVDNAFAFTALFRDVETGLYRPTYRTYDDQVGSFMQEDPIGLARGEDNPFVYVDSGETLSEGTLRWRSIMEQMHGASSLYQYAFESPTNYVDPRGTSPLLLAPLVRWLLSPPSPTAFCMRANVALPYYICTPGDLSKADWGPYLLRDKPDSIFRIFAFPRNEELGKAMSSKSFRNRVCLGGWSL